MLFNIFGNNGGGKQHRHRFCHKKGCPPGIEDEDVYSLSECPRDTVCIVVCNPVKKTKEIGINPGREINVFKNEPSDTNMIISLENSRYIIAKSLADKILVTVKDS